MLPYERHEKIIECFREKRFLSVEDLCNTLFFSEATIRRDLEKIENLGIISRVRGGAVLNDSTNELPLFIRQTENKKAKQIIAQKAAEYVHDSDILILDASSTVLQMIPFLCSKKNLTIITNGLVTATSIAESMKCKIYCTGGILRENCSSSLVGSQAKNFISNIHAAKMFFSAKSVSPIYGLSDTTEEEAELKKIMMKHAERSILLADSSKHDQVSFYYICTLADIDEMITNESEALSNESWKNLKTKITTVKV